jgi:tryptophanyl-tRNA synthetase
MPRVSKKEKAESVEEELPESQSGCGKKKSPWMDHVKSYREKHQCSLKDAMKNAKLTYKK